eukprot:jgi/Botrbrau1/11911/Bobra.0171s0021.1
MLVLQGLDLCGLSRHKRFNVCSAPSIHSTMFSQGFAALPILDVCVTRLSALRRSGLPSLSNTRLNASPLSRLQQALKRGVDSQDSARCVARKDNSEVSESYREFWPVAGFEFIDISSSCRLNLVLLENRHQRLLAHDLRDFTEARFGALQEAYLSNLKKVIDQVEKGDDRNSSSVLQGLIREIAALDCCMAAWNPKLHMARQALRKDWQPILARLGLSKEQVKEVLCRRSTYLQSTSDFRDDFSASTLEDERPAAPKVPDLGWTCSIYHQNRRLCSFNNRILRQVLTPLQAGKALIMAAPHHPDMLGIAELLQEENSTARACEGQSQTQLYNDKAMSRREAADDREAASESISFPFAQSSSRNPSPVLGLLSVGERSRCDTTETSSSDDISRLLDFKLGQLPVPGMLHHYAIPREAYTSSSDDKSNSHRNEGGRGGGYLKALPEVPDLDSSLRRRPQTCKRTSVHDDGLSYNNLQCRTDMAKKEGRGSMARDPEEPTSPVWFFQPSTKLDRFPQLPTPFARYQDPTFLDEEPQLASVSSMTSPHRLSASMQAEQQRTPWKKFDEPDRNVQLSRASLDASYYSCRPSPSRPDPSQLHSRSLSFKLERREQPFKAISGPTWPHVPSSRIRNSGDKDYWPDAQSVRRSDFQLPAVSRYEPEKSRYEPGNYTWLYPDPHSITFGDSVPSGAEGQPFVNSRFTTPRTVHSVHQHKGVRTPGYMNRDLEKPSPCRSLRYPKISRDWNAATAESPNQPEFEAAEPYAADIFNERMPTSTKLRPVMGELLFPARKGRDPDLPRSATFPVQPPYCDPSPERAFAGATKGHGFDLPLPRSITYPSPFHSGRVSAGTTLEEGVSTSSINSILAALQQESLQNFCGPVFSPCGELPEKQRKQWVKESAPQVGYRAPSTPPASSGAFFPGKSGASVSCSLPEN